MLEHNITKILSIRGCALFIKLVGFNAYFSQKIRRESIKLISKVKPKGRIPNNYLPYK